MGKSWQKELVKVLDNQQISTSRAKKEDQVPDAQLVFCIDTRSELIRRHIENKGHYETFGYAGFFGIAMDYEDLKEGLTRKSCPYFKLCLPCSRNSAAESDCKGTSLQAKKCCFEL